MVLTISVPRRHADKMNNFYVYEHWRPDVGECFYVGKGRGKRAREMCLRNQHHKNIQKKLASLGYSVDIRIVVAELSEYTAFMVEKERIAYWRSVGASLCNHTDGGEGPSGYKLTKEQRAKISATHRGKKKTEDWKAKIALGNKGKIVSSETCARISDAQKELRKRVPMSKENLEKMWAAKCAMEVSDETRRKMSEAARKNHKVNPRGADVREKIGAAQRGVKRKPHSEDTKRKMSEAAIAWRTARRLAQVETQSQSPVATPSR